MVKQRLLVNSQSKFKT